MEALPTLLNQTLAARVLGCDRKIVQRAEARGQLHQITEGREKLYHRSEIIDLRIKRNSK